MSNMQVFLSFARLSIRFRKQNLEQIDALCAPRVAHPAFTDAFTDIGYRLLAIDDWTGRRNLPPKDGSRTSGITDNMMILRQGTSSQPTQNSEAEAQNCLKAVW